jgi:hypothetical protein
LRCGGLSPTNDWSVKLSLTQSFDRHMLAETREEPPRSIAECLMSRSRQPTTERAMSDQKVCQEFQLADEWAIANRLHQYCRACDRHDSALLRSVFHDDAVIHHPPLNAPVDEFCRNLIEFVHGLGPSLHYISNLLIEFEDGIAYTEAYFTAWHHLPADMAPNAVFSAHKPGVGEDVHLGGRYFNWFKRREGCWRVSRHTTIVEWERWEVTNNRTALTDLGRRLSRFDRGDPAYERSAAR